MKKIITSALVLALSIGAVQAQKTNTKESKETRKERKQDRQHDLDLSADQKARMKAIHEARQAEMKALKTQSLNAEQTKAKREEIQKKYHAERLSVLNADQKAKMEQLKAQRKESGKNGKFSKGHKGSKMGMKRGEGQSYGRNLDLSAEQQARMKAIREEYKGQFEALRADKSSTQEQKRARMQELMKSQQEQMKSVLTKEQLEQMESRKKQRPVKNTK